MAYAQGWTGRAVCALLLALCLLAVVVSRADGATVRVATSGTGTGVVRIEAVNVPSTFSTYWGNCPPYCGPEKIDDGLIQGLSTAMVFTARPADGSAFAGWSGACTGTAPVCRVPLVGRVEATAKFTRKAAQPKTTTRAAPTTQPKPNPRPSAANAPAPGPPPKWKLVVTGKVIFSVRGSYVSGHAEVRLAGVQLPALKKGQKRADFQKGGRFWVLARHEPRNVRLLYRGQTLGASQSLQIDEAEPAIQYHFYFTPNGAARQVFSVLGGGTGTLVFTTDAGAVRVPVTVSIIPYS